MSKQINIVLKLSQARIFIIMLYVRLGKKNPNWKWITKNKLKEMQKPTTQGKNTLE